MITRLSHVTIWVRDQEEARKFYAEILGFTVRADDATTIPGFRWLTVAPHRQSDVEIILGLATEPEQLALVGMQGTWVLTSDNVHEDYRRLVEYGVKVRSEPQENPWGRDFVFEDLYGNSFDLVQPPERRQCG